MAAPLRTLRLWFSFDVPVDRRTYVVHGAALMLFKYLVDAALIWRFAGVFWTPLDYLTPLWSVRQDVLNRGPDWLGPALIVFALPFVWIGVSMSLRRAVNAGRSPWLALLFFVPVVNYLLMAVLSFLPSLSRVAWPVEPPPPQVDERLKSALLGVAATVAITLVTVGIGVYLRRTYSAGLFLGAPFTMGYAASYIYNRRFPRSIGESLTLATASVAVAGGAVVVFALEGIICTAMAIPVAIAVALPGAVLGRIVAQRSLEAGGLAVLIAPLLVALEPRAAPPVREVVSTVEIDASPQDVWQYVATFPKIAPPDEWLFRAGVAAPVAARIEGSGAGAGGAVRYCDFTTGTFVEPITAWEEGRLLAFGFTGQAPPMRELSPYGNIRAPHLDGYFRASHGEFRLEELPGGRTRLVGTTRYEVEMFPQAYWAIFADYIVERIHIRVLEHIEAIAEGR